VKYSFLHPEESGTASGVLTRVFATANHNMVTIVAAGGGDGLVAVFDPHNHTLRTLIKPRQYNRGGDQFTPISITENLVGDMLQCIHEDVPVGSILFRMTDGAWEALPHLCGEPLMDQKCQKQYMDYSLDEELGKKLKDFALEFPQASATEYRGYLQKMIKHNIKEQKTKIVDQSEKIRSQLSAFRGGVDKSTVGDFITTTCQYYPEFRTQFDNYMTILNLVKTDLDKMPLSALEVQLEHLSLGDDVTLNVEVAVVYSE